MRRGDVVEAVHFVHVASTEGVLHGEDVVSHLRSSAKPIQAIPLADAYDDLDDDELAIACASHQAEPAQLDAVRKLLARAGASVDDLECGPQEGRPEGKLGHNCSGKHAGFLAVCREKGWPFEGYRLLEHPVQRRIRELAVEISRDYAERDLLLVCVLKGAVFFTADLMRHLEIEVELDFMAVASYGSATDSSGVVRILKDLDVPIEGRNVLIVEDIVDSGLTLQYLLRSLGARNPASVEVCALLTKPERRKVDLPVRYVGFEIANCFAIGYGLDHRERFRNLPFVAALAGT